jgi:hypothetical protein
MTETVKSQESLLPLRNGARVLAADIVLHPSQTARGVVLAASSRTGEYVTWEVERAPGEQWFTAYWGHYFDQAYSEALADYNERRSGR